MLIPLWNAWYFFTLYANVAQGGAGYDAKIDRDSTDVLDRYILAKLDDFVADLTRELDALNIAAACDSARNFLEVLSNWYIRRSRDRFWDGESADSLAAFDTLYTVLETTTRALAPLLPLTTEEIWRGPDRRPLGAPDRLAEPRPTRSSAAADLVRGDGPGPRGLLDRVGAAQGGEPPGPAAVGVADRGRRRRRRRCGRSPS